MTECYMKAENKDYILKIKVDTDPMNPREDENIGTIVGWHRNYNLGDKHNHDNPREFLAALADEVLTEEEKLALYRKALINGGYEVDEDDEDWDLDEVDGDALLEAIQKYAVILPVYMFEHGGVALSTGDFNDPWDSGQVGWIYATNEKAMYEYGKENLEEARKKTADYMEGEIKIYSDYLNGECYGYELIKKDREGTEQCPGDEEDEYGTYNEVDEDSCWGFFGDEWEKNGLLCNLGEKHKDLVDALTY